MHFQISETLETSEVEMVVRTLEESLRALAKDVVRSERELVAFGIGPSPRVKNARDRAVFVSTAEEAGVQVKVDVNYQASGLMGDTSQNEVVRDKVLGVIEEARIRLRVRRVAPAPPVSSLPPVAVTRSKPTVNVFARDVLAASTANGVVAEVPVPIAIEEKVEAVPVVAAQVAADPIAAAVAEPSIAPIATPIAVVAAEPAIVPLADTVAEPVFAPIATLVAAVVTEPVVAPTAPPVAVAVAEPAEAVAEQEAAVAPVKTAAKEPGQALEPSKLPGAGNEADQVIERWRSDAKQRGKAPLEAYADSAGKSRGKVWGWIAAVVVCAAAGAGWVMTHPRKVEAPVVVSQPQAASVAADPLPWPSETEEHDLGRWLQNWADTMSTHDAAAQTGFYADPVDRYFRAANVGHAALLESKRAALENSDALSTMTIEDIRIVKQAEDSASVRLVKHIVTQAPKHPNADQRVQCQLKVKRIDGSWRIVEEHNLG